MILHNELVITTKLASIESNIEYYQNLYNKHITLANTYNKELWRWIYEQKKLQDTLKQTDRGQDT
jgi:hypothetical protein